MKHIFWDRQTTDFSSLAVLSIYVHMDGLFYSFYFLFIFFDGFASITFSPKSRFKWLVRLLIRCPLPIALGIILFIVMPLSTRNSFTNKLFASTPMDLALATAESKSFLIGNPARLAKKSSSAIASLTFFPFTKEATSRTFLGACL